MDDWRGDEAKNQVRFRAENEASLAALAGREPDAFVCECSDAGCRETIRLTRAEYEAVRREPTYFLIALDHENPEIDRVVVEHDDYAVAEKTDPAAARIARANDPRGPNHRGSEPASTAPHAQLLPTDHD